MDTNDWLQLFDDRIRHFSEVLGQQRTSCPLAVSILEELLRDVQRVREEMFPPEN